MLSNRSLLTEQDSFSSAYPATPRNGRASFDNEPKQRKRNDPDFPLVKSNGKSEGGDDAFKEEVIKDILCQIDYRSAWRKNIVDLSYDELAEEMRQLPTRALVAWYEAFLYIRSELMFSGYELNGFKILDRPYDAIRKLIESDPNFDIRQYIF